MSGTRPAWVRKFSPSNVSIVYIYGALFLLFGAWKPKLWFNWTTHKSVINIGFVTPSIVAVGLLVPLLAGVFDLSIAGVMNASAITVSWLMVNKGWSIGPAILAAIVVSMIAGVINGILVVRVGIDSFIATLASGAVLGAYAQWRSGGLQITGLPESYKNLSRRTMVFGIQWKVAYLIVIALVVWYIFEHTPIGRYLQATGDNEDAARLAGVQTKRFVVGSLLASSLVAGIAGVVQTASIGGGNANVGNPYLLSAFAAAFLGSTQFKGRFNVWGTVAAVWVLLSGVKGVELVYRSTPWLNDLFFGAALIVAVGMSQILDKVRVSNAARRRSAAAAGVSAGAG